MKKLMLVVLVCILSISMVATAEDAVDYTSMSDEELQEVFSTVQEILRERGLFEGEPFYPGTYVVGTDIKAGSYVLHVIEATGAFREYHETASVKITGSDGESVSDTVEVGGSYSLNLKDGDTLHLEDANCLIESVDKPSFAP